MSSKPQASILVALSETHPEPVVATAVELAHHFNAALVFASVNEAAHVVGHTPDGKVTSMSFNPDVVDVTEERFNPKLQQKLEAALGNSDVTWSTNALAGDPAHAVSDLADKIDARMIVVGTRQETVRGNLHEFFNGSIAVHLAHRQHRPVVVVPLAPIPFDHPLPWNED